MQDRIAWVKNTCPATDCSDVLALMAREEMHKVRAFHKSFPQYDATPLVRLPALAEKLGVRGVYVKDESYRFGLNAFKVLGGSFAIAKYIASLVGCDVAEMSYERLTSKALRDQIGQVTFFTATDGNHGRGVAWAANKLGQKAVVYMPKGSSHTRLANIRKEGAKAEIIEGNYDEAVRLAAAQSAKTPNSVVVQDTAWDGYEEIPGWIMQGYGTMALEADEQLSLFGGGNATHIFVQAGVGSMASAVAGYFVNRYGSRCPKISIVEPCAVACLYESAKAHAYRVIEGDTQTIMAGLNCGSPNTISWELLKNYTDHFISCPDWVAAKGMRVLSNPLKDDKRIISGESGAVGAGLLATVMQREGVADLREALGLDESSIVLLFSTEGQTDPQRFEDIVWDGEYGRLARFPLDRHEPLY